MKYNAEQIKILLSEKLHLNNVEVELIGSGAWSNAFLFENKGLMNVIRVSEFLDNFEKDYYMSKFSSEDLPIPKFITYGQYRNDFYCVTEFKKGTFFEKLPAESLNLILNSIFSLFKSLLEINIEDTKGYGYFDKDGNGEFNSWKDFLLSVNDNNNPMLFGWRANLAQEKDIYFEYKKLLEIFKTKIQYCPELRNIIHSDLLNFNLLANDEKISAVLDWGSAKIGDPLYDLAWFEFYEPYYPEFTRINLCSNLKSYVYSIIGDKKNFEERLLCYKLHIALDSIIYNASRKQWDYAKDAIQRALTILSF